MLAEHSRSYPCPASISSVVMKHCVIDWFTTVSILENCLRFWGESRSCTLKWPRRSGGSFTAELRVYSHKAKGDCLAETLRLTGLTVLEMRFIPFTGSHVVAHAICILKAWGSTTTGATYNQTIENPTNCDNNVCFYVVAIFWYGEIDQLEWVCMTCHKGSVGSVCVLIITDATLREGPSHVKQYTMKIGNPCHTLSTPKKQHFQCIS